VYGVHIHVKAKMISVETTPGMGEEGKKESGGGHEFKYDML
jgi:hypothetical protein